MDYSERKPLVDGQVDELCENFDTYIAEFKGSHMNSRKYVSCHKETIDLGKKLGGVAKSIESDEFLCSLYSTLVAWKMDDWKANLQEYDEFVKAIRMFSPLIVSLEGVGLAQIDDADITRVLFSEFKPYLAGWGLGHIDEADITRELLYAIVHKMGLSQMRVQTITGAKALHHMLPQLLPPIDGRYTGRFFQYSGSGFQNNKRAFNLMLSSFKRIAQDPKVDLGRYVGTADWATSESKMIDNAIIGYCFKHPERLPKR